MGCREVHGRGNEHGCIGISNVVLTPLLRYEPAGKDPTSSAARHLVSYYNTSLMMQGKDDVAVLGDCITPLIRAARAVNMTVTLGLMLFEFGDVYKLNASAAHTFFAKVLRIQSFVACGMVRIFEWRIFRCGLTSVRSLTESPILD